MTTICGKASPGWTTGPGAGGKAWLNQLLEHNPGPTLWMTNRIEQIDPAVRRSFAYHLELGSPPPGAREQLVRKALEGVPSSPELVARLVAGDGAAQLEPAEADSFLLGRRGAQRHHELSEVNEMLQGMERFRGVFVCTTNLLERIDAAALRRFSFKILFKPLRPEQRLTLFAREALGAVDAPLEQSWRARLLRLDQLCLGDYAAVSRQLEILQESLDPEGWLEQLEAEHRLKPEVRERRSMGFTD